LGEKRQKKADHHPCAQIVKRKRGGEEETPKTREEKPLCVMVPEFPSTAHLQQNAKKTEKKQAERTDQGGKALDPSSNRESQNDCPGR